MKLPGLLNTCAIGATVSGGIALFGADPLKVAVGYVLSYCLIRALELALEELKS